MMMKIVANLEVLSVKAPPLTLVKVQKTFMIILAMYW